MPLDIQTGQSLRPVPPSRTPASLAVHAQARKTDPEVPGAYVGYALFGLSQERREELESTILTWALLSENRSCNGFRRITPVRTWFGAQGNPIQRTYDQLT